MPSDILKTPESHLFHRQAPAPAGGDTSTSGHSHGDAAAPAAMLRSAAGAAAPPGPHHSVGHAGGFSRGEVIAMLAHSGLRLAAFDPEAAAYEKEVPGVGPKSFPLFMAVAEK